ncbi:MAG: hypothetical protein C4542_05495 [Dehalococcoidia bacterium]|nr:MAG: hypothetical protein C4542_05495 [Dehalococcoidia bacterium]
MIRFGLRTIFKKRGDVLVELRRIVSILIIFALCFINISCGKKVNNKTPEDAARTFMQAMTRGDSKLMELINKSPFFAYPPSHALATASERELSKYKLEDFQFKKINEDTVQVTSGKAGIDWELKMTMVDGKWFFYNIE